MMLGSNEEKRAGVAMWPEGKCVYIMLTALISKQSVDAKKVVLPWASHSISE